MQLVGQTPREIRLAEQAARSSLRGKLSSLPKPKEMDFELDLPEEQVELSAEQVAAQAQEDSAARDKRNAELAHAAALAEFKRQTRVVQRGLPRPKVVDIEALLKTAKAIEDPTQRAIAEENALLIANDALKFGGSKVTGNARPVQVFDEESLQKAQMEVILEMGQDTSSAQRAQFGKAFEREWEAAHAGREKILPGLAGYGEDELDEEQLLTEAFDNIQESITKISEKGSSLEKKLAKLQGGYLERQKKLRAKIVEASEALAKTRLDVQISRQAHVAEEAAIQGRLEISKTCKKNSVIKDSPMEDPSMLKLAGALETMREKSSKGVVLLSPKNLTKGSSIVLFYRGEERDMLP